MNGITNKKLMLRSKQEKMKWFQKSISTQLKISSKIAAIPIK